MLAGRRALGNRRRYKMTTNSRQAAGDFAAPAAYPAAMRFRFPLLLLLPAMAQAAPTAWFSYRAAYHALARFETWPAPRDLIEMRFQIVTRDGAASTDGLRLTLSGRSGRTALPLDSAGQAVLPLSKQAYDDNAVLALDRPAGLAALPRVSIAVRADGQYDIARLRAACEQVRGFLAYAQGRPAPRCAGVRFAYRAGDGHATPTARHGGTTQALAEQPGGAYTGERGTAWSAAEVRFADWPAGSVTAPAPAVIDAVLE
jgi:hypothetical protein